MTLASDGTFRLSADSCDSGTWTTIGNVVAMSDICFVYPSGSC